MQITRKVAPSQKGAQKGNRTLLDQYGSKLVRVRYRYDEQRHKRFKAIELIIEGSPWTPPTRASNDRMVGVRVAFKEVELQRKVKQAGGGWNPARRVWEMRYDRAVALGLKDRIEELKVSDNTNRKSY